MSDHQPDGRGIVWTADWELHCPSIDVCAFCGDSECDGLGCIQSLDTDVPGDEERIEQLHTWIRLGRIPAAGERRPRDGREPARQVRAEVSGYPTAWTDGTGQRWQIEEHTLPVIERGHLMRVLDMLWREREARWWAETAAYDAAMEDKDWYAGDAYADLNDPNVFDNWFHSHGVVIAAKARFGLPYEWTPEMEAL